MLFRKLVYLGVSILLMPLIVLSEKEDIVCRSPELTIHIKRAKKHARLQILLVGLGKTTKTIKKILEIVKKDLEFSGQFSVIIPDEKCIRLNKKNDLKRFFTPDCRLGILLSKEKGSQEIGWRLYDLEDVSMIKGVQYTPKGTDINGWAHNISDAIWPVLSSCPGTFSSKIAFCKEIKKYRKRAAYKHIYVADYDGSNAKLLVSTPTINIAPRWNSDPVNPLIFYSEHTNKNVRLVFVDMRRKIIPVSSFDGLNILSAFSHDGKQFAYCSSRGDGYCQLYYYTKGQLKRLTNKGNNICPTFADSGRTIYYCSDSSNKFPQICKYDISTQKTQLVTQKGFYVSTSFSQENGLLAYAKMINGIMQIFVFDPKNNTHRQLTFDLGNKEECSWSPCGNYLLFSVENGNNSRIAVLQLATNQKWFITSKSDNCFYPCWSPIYSEYPVVS